jgi:hypothetical protein
MLQLAESVRELQMLTTIMEEAVGSLERLRNSLEARIRNSPAPTEADWAELQYANQQLRLGREAVRQARQQLQQVEWLLQVVP